MTNFQGVMKKQKRVIRQVYLNASNARFCCRVDVSKYRKSRKNAK